MVEAVLDLEQYFERDIIEFLDKQKALQDSEEKHTVTEMLSALALNNVALAAKLLENEVVGYNKIPIDNVYKEIHFKKLGEMLMQAQEFIRLHPQPSRLKEYVDLLTSSNQLNQGLIDKITAFDAKIAEKEEQKLKAQEQEKQFVRGLEERFKTLSEELTLEIRKKNFSEAVKKYKDLKICFEQYPSTAIADKQEIYNDLLSFYMQINKLKRELADIKVKNTDDRKKLEIASVNQTNKYLRLEEINIMIKEIKEAVRHSDFNAATQKIIELREIASRVPDNYKHIRSILNSKIDVMNQRIDFVKRMREHN